jgi:glucose/mannose-6-phosphate isomerase
MEYPLSPNDIPTLDRSDYLALLMDLPDQIDRARELADAAVPKTGAGSISKIVVAGMGGSAIGGDLLRTYLLESLPVPFLVHRDYDLPPFVDPGTLVFLSSYSGNTEETLSAAEAALRSKARVMAVASGGELARLAQRKGFPLIQLPGGLPPRAAIGYSFMALLGSLVRIGLVDERTAEVEETIGLLKEKRTLYGIQAKAPENLAKRLSVKLFGQFPVIYAWSRRYQAVALRWRGQLAEIAKQLCSHHLLPEMNHNELAGWQHPAEILSQTVVVLLRDDDEPERIGRRMDLTARSLASRAGGLVEARAEGRSLLARLFSLIYLGDWVSYYLAALNGVDPTPIERIEELKSRLAGGKT